MLCPLYLFYSPVSTRMHERTLCGALPAASLVLTNFNFSILIPTLFVGGSSLFSLLHIFTTSLPSRRKNSLRSAAYKLVILRGSDAGSKVSREVERGRAVNGYCSTFELHVPRCVVCKSALRMNEGTDKGGRWARYSGDTPPLYPLFPFSSDPLSPTHT